jgi:hypothetical protein
MSNEEKRNTIHILIEALRKEVSATLRENNGRLTPAQTYLLCFYKRELASLN